MSKRITASAIAAGLCLSLWSATPPAAHAQGADGGVAAYINTTALNLRAKPGTGKVLGILVKYDPVSVLEQTQVGGQTWYSIEAPGGYTNGWVAARSRSCKPTPACVEFGESPTAALRANIDYGAKQVPTLISGVAQYVGANACRECHKKPTGSFNRGASGIWQNHYHAQAYQTLTRDYTREIAQRTRGVDAPAEDWRCLKCHETAFGADARDIASSYDPKEGVGCEVCHGPGSKYKDVDHGPNNPGREALGFRLLRDLAERREVCTSCHNDASPTFIGFDLRGFSREIAHWNPRENDFFYGEATTEVARRDAAVDRERDRAAEAAAAAAAERLAAQRQASQRAELSAADTSRERDRLAREARARAEAEERARAERQRAEAARELAQVKARDAARDRQVAAVAQRAKREVSGDPLASFLKDVDDVIKLNKDGDKYSSVKFSHLAHAGKKYLPEGNCNTCHHTQEGNEQPEPCSSCHEIGGEADEQKKKTRAVHLKGLAYPKEAGQEQVSCVGCHKSIRAAASAGSYAGDPPPVKCTSCHKRKS